MSINELQDEVIAEFSDFDDWMDRYQLLIDLGNEQEPLDEKYKTEQNLIEGCQSRVWLQADDVDGKIVFNAESDALIVKGIIALLIKVLSGHTPDEILNADGHAGGGKRDPGIAHRGVAARLRRLCDLGLRRVSRALRKG